MGPSHCQKLSDCSSYAVSAGFACGEVRPAFPELPSPAEGQVQAVRDSCGKGGACLPHCGNGTTDGREWQREDPLSVANTESSSIPCYSMGVRAPRAGFPLLPDDERSAHRPARVERREPREPSGLRLPKWRKDLEERLEEAIERRVRLGSPCLQHLVDRAKEVCKRDRSIAIAHCLEHLCEVAAPKAKSKKKKKIRYGHRGNV